MKKLEDLIKLLKNLFELSFTGSIEIHLNQGTIARVVKHERLR